MVHPWLEAAGRWCGFYMQCLQLIEYHVQRDKEPAHVLLWGVRGFAIVLVSPLARPQRCPAVTRHRPRLHGSGDLHRLKDTPTTPDSTRFVFRCFWCAFDFFIVYRGGRGLRACGVAAPAWLPTVCLRRLA